MIAGKFVTFKSDALPMELLQPTNLKNNDTTSETTGTAVAKATGDAAATSAAATSAAARRFAHFMF